jgi:hypothetical protein
MRPGEKIFEAAPGVRLASVRPRVGRPTSPLIRRAASAGASLVFMAVFTWVYNGYLSIEYAYSGFYYRDSQYWETLFIMLCIAVNAFSLPVKIARPSGISYWFLHVFVLVPTLVVTFKIGLSSPGDYVPALVALTLVLTLGSALAQLSLRDIVERPYSPSVVLTQAVTMVWGGLTAILIWQYAGIMGFVGIDDIYYQRSLVSAERFAWLIEYGRAYYSYVITPLLLTVGLLRRSIIPITLAVAGFIISYMIDASKISLIIGPAILSIYAAQRKGITSPVVYTGGTAVLVALAAGLTTRSAAARYFADVFLLRALAVPGQTFAQYHDYFSSKGFTWWSNVKGINKFIAPPPAYASDQDWPALGVMIGRYYYRWVSDVNASANLFSGEGVAAGGVIGVLVIGALLAGWLRFLDWSGRNWSPMFLVLLMVPVAMALTNAHLSTVLLSFGGALITAFLVFYRPGRSHSRRSRRQNRHRRPNQKAVRADGAFFS